MNNTEVLYKVEPGTFVYYHGSILSSHGLYKVIYRSLDKDNFSGDYRYSLVSPKGETLHNARRVSFTPLDDYYAWSK